MSAIALIALGVVAGLALAFAHARTARAAAQAALEAKSSARLLVGFPVRVGVPAAALFGLAVLSPWALAGGVSAFVVGQRLALRSS